MRSRLLTTCLMFVMLASLSLPAVAQHSGDDNEATKSSKKDSKTKRSDQKKTKKKPKANVAEITMKGSLPEGDSPLAAFGVDDANLLGMIRRLEKAAGDKKVKTVVLQLRNPTLGRGKLNELRRAIQKTRKAGKTVYANIEAGTTADYLVAAACDKIVMPESGYLMMPGIRAEVMFYRNLFDKLGIQPDFLQVGDFKGAAEPYMRSKMSEAFRKQLETVLDDYFDQMIETIAEDRDLEESAVKKAVDRGMFTATQAKEAGLIDMVAYDQDWQDEITDASPAHDVDWVENYAKKQVDTDFSGMGGFIRLMEMFSGGKSSSGKSGKKRIAVVYALGPIMTGKSTTSFMGARTMGSDTIVEALQEADEDDSVAAIVFRVDSPGGSALASDLIWNKIQQIEKPVICSMGDVAASGGYYIAMGCDKIYAEPGTLTGSIGVVSGKLAMGRMFRKIGLTTDTIARGRNSGMFSVDEKFSESERKAMQEMMDETYEQFTGKAADGRGMDLDDLKLLAGGRVWTGRQAKENGLVDEVGTLADAVRKAQEMTGMDTDDEPRLRILPKAKSFFEQMFEDASVSAPGLAAIPQPLRKELAEMEMLQVLFKEPVLMLTPVRISY